MTGRPSSQELADRDENRIPDELLPDGVGPAWWDPEITRLHAEACCRHRLDHNMEIKAWIVLHLMNECDSLVARLQATEQALRQTLDCKGSYNGTVSERGGEPAICIKCEEAARRALEGAAE